MKKLFLAASLLIAATSFTGVYQATASSLSTAAKGDGQHISPSQVPAPVMASFNANFPNANNVKWEKEKEHGQVIYQADFVMNGQRWRATFIADGALLSTKSH